MCSNLINGLVDKKLSHVVIQPTLQEFPHSVQLLPQDTVFSASEIREIGGCQSPEVSQATFLLIYPVNFHCYSFIIIKFMGEKDGIILKHN